MRLNTCVLALAVLCAGTQLSGCNRGVDGASARAAARDAIGKQDYRTALISAKNALRAVPGDAELRRILGISLLETGDPVSAAVELRKARELGASESTTAPWLAKAVLAQRDAKQVVAQFASMQLDDAAAAAELKTTVATAHAILGERAAAAEDAEAALKEWPQHAGAKLLQARLAAVDGRLDDADAKVATVLAAEPKNIAALVYKGDLQRMRGDDDKALTAYRAAVAAKPDSVLAGAATVALLLQKQRLAEATTELGKLRAVAPNQVETRLLDLQLAFLKKDYARARELAGQLLKAMPQNPVVLQMAGETEFRLGSIGAAENYLTQALQAAPRSVGARKLLAQIALRGGQSQRALEVLQPLLTQDPPDAEALAFAGQAWLLQGDAARADAMFAKAARTDPDNTTARIALALNKLAQGNQGAAYAELEATAAADTGPRADLALIAARLRGRDVAGAMRAIDALEKKQPQQPLPQVLRGQVQMRQKELAAARASFEKALLLDPRYFPATASLAELDVAAGQPAAAQQRYAALLKAEPKNQRALLGLADLKARAGGTRDEIAALFNDAVKANPGDPAARVALIEFLLPQDPRRALAAAQDAMAALPGDNTVLNLLGAAQLGVGQAQQAISTFGKLAAAQPTRPQPELALADAHIAAQDYDAARRSLERASKLQPGSQAAQAGLVRVALLQKRHDDAVRIAREMQAASPKVPLPYVLEAEAELARGTPAAAVAPLKRALPLSQSANAAILLHRVLLKLDRGDEADRVAAAWRKDHPQDPAFAFYLGDMALARADYATAEAQYKAVTQLQPENALALNNIAWLMTRQQKPGAVQVAEQANKLLPNRAPLLDTLALALAQENQLPRAIDVQKQAVATFPDDPGLKLTLARLYARAGDKTHARVQLDDLARLGPKFGGQGEVAELMKTVQ